MAEGNGEKQVSSLSSKLQGPVCKVRMRRLRLEMSKRFSFRRRTERITKFERRVHDKWKF